MQVIILQQLEGEEMNQLERAVLGTSNREIDEGLRQLMLTMYNHTASGLAVSGAVAWLTYSSCLLYTSPSPRD